MTTDILRAADPVRVLHPIRAALAQYARPKLPPELPTHEQLKETRDYQRFATTAPHILAAGGRFHSTRIPR
jgi:hypothetical protein